MAKGTIAIARVVGLMFLVLAFGGCESQGMGGTSVSSPSTESTQSTPTAAHSAGGDQGVASSLVASPTSTTSTTEVPDPWGDRDCGWQLQSYSAADIDAMSSMPVLSAVMHGDVDELATLLRTGSTPTSGMATTSCHRSWRRWRLIARKRSSYFSGPERHRMPWARP